MGLFLILSCKGGTQKPRVAPKPTKGGTKNVGVFTGNWGIKNNHFDNRRIKARFL